MATSKPLPTVPVATSVAAGDRAALVQGGAVKQAPFSLLPVPDSVTLAIQDLNQQLNSVAQQQAAIKLDAIPPGTGIDATSIKSITIDGVARNLPNTLAYLAARIGSGVPSPTAPFAIVNAALTFPGGTADVGENATYARGTWAVNVTCTGSLAAATSATLTTAWTGTSTTYTALFSDGTTKTVTLTNAATSITWSGAVTANSTVRVTLASGGSGIITQFNAQTIINGSTQSGSGTVTYNAISNGAAIPVPTQAGAGSFGIFEFSISAAGTASNQSINYPVSANGVPTIATAPVINPTSPIDTDILVPTKGVYTVNGITISQSDPLLSRTYRYSFDWTLTASLSGGATSATLSSNWLSTGGAFTVRFSNGDSRSVTLTQNAATATWTGGLSGSATSAVKIQVATTATLQLNTNNNGHVGRYFETATYNGIAGSEVEASNTVTSSASGGTLEPGHRFLASIPATGPKSWADYQTQRALYPVTSGFTSQDAEALVASIPASGGSTLGPSSTVSQIETALASGNVFLTGGTYTCTSQLDIPAGRWLIGVSGQTIILDFSSWVGHGVHTVGDGARLINVTIKRAQELALFLQGNGCFFYKVAISEAGYNLADGWMAIGSYGHSQVFVSCECLNTIGGGDSDGWHFGASNAGNWTCVDCHAFENDDDGFDTWDTTASCFLHYCTSTRNGRNTSTGAISGDGNGYKLGGPTGSTTRHFLNQCVGTDGKAYAFNYNGTASGQKHTLRLCTASGNLLGTYAFSGDIPDADQYDIVNA